MPGVIEAIIVVGVIAVAAVFLLHVARKRLRGHSGCGCAPTSSKPKRTNLTIDGRRAG